MTSTFANDNAAEAAGKIAELFRSKGKPPPEEGTPHAEAARRLLDEYDIYVEHMHNGDNYDGGFFTPGMLITPREKTYFTDVGEPYIVLEVFEADSNAPIWAADWAGTMRDGFMPNVRIGRWTSRGMVAAWVESWAFEEYGGPVA